MSNTPHPPHASSLGGLIDPTYREPLIRLRDNPIALAQWRAQLRQKKGRATVQIAALLSLSALLLTYSLNKNGQPEPWRVAQSALSWLIFVTLYWRGSARLMEAVAQERDSGVFIFLRSSPLSPYSVAWGYLVGGASRAYLSALTIAPAWLLCGSLGGATLPTLSVALCALFLGALTLHALTLTFALSASGSRGMKWGMNIGILGLYLLAEQLNSFGAHTLSHLTPIPTFSALGLTLWGELFKLDGVAVFGLHLNNLSYSLLVQGLAVGASLWVAARKVERDGQALMSRRGGLGLLGALTLLLMGVDLNPASMSKLGDVNSAMSYLPGALALLLVLGLYAAWLLVSSTPTLISAQRSSARWAKRQKVEPLKARLPWWDEGASLLPFCLAFVVFISAALGAYFWLHGGLEVLSFGLRAGLIPSALGVSVALFALSGLSERAYLSFGYTLSPQQSASLSLWASALTIFLAPLLLALASAQLGLKALIEPLFALSPLYALSYAVHALLAGASGVREGLPHVSFTWAYEALSLLVGLTVGSLSYLKAAQLRRERLTQMSDRAPRA